MLRLRSIKPRSTALKPVSWKLPRNLSYNYNTQYKPPTSAKTKFLIGSLIVSSLGYTIYYLYWPKHTFPSPVATTLRKGLWAESDKGGNDYTLALKYYIESLEKCNELNLNPLTDEYTGIQLKIGEMFERLNMLDKASLIYNEIGSLYLKTLHDKNLTLSQDYRNHLIQKSLRIGVKLSELAKHDLNLSKAILIAHSSAATMEINKLINLAHASPTDNQHLKLNLLFLDEYFNAINLLIVINIQLGDFSFAMDKTLKLYKLMKISNVEPKKYLLNICNLGGLSYLQSEMFELKLLNILKSNNIPIPHDLNSNPFITHDDQPPGDDVHNIDERIKASYNENLNHFNIYINYATEVYEFVLARANELVGNKPLSKPSIAIPSDLTSTSSSPSSSSSTTTTVSSPTILNPTPAAHLHPLNDEEIMEIQEIIALSTYSLGVINLHLKNYDKAERLLRESRVKSKSCNYVDLIEEIENELKKLFKERAKLQ